MSIILTSLTTILSFGTLMLAQHRGLQSLGMVLAIGTASCWLSSLLILPAILNVFCRRPVGEEENTELWGENGEENGEENETVTAVQDPLLGEEVREGGERRGLFAEDVSVLKFEGLPAGEAFQIGENVWETEVPSVICGGEFDGGEFDGGEFDGGEFDGGERFQGRRVTCYTWDVNGEVVNAAGKAA